MTTRETFRKTMAERRTHDIGTAEHDYLTRTCRQLVWIIRKIPTKDWPK